MNEQSHPDCEACKADKAREDERQKMVAEYVARQKAADEAARQTMLSLINDRFGLNEDDSYEVYSLWEEYLDWHG